MNEDRLEYLISGLIRGCPVHLMLPPYDKTDFCDLPRGVLEADQASSSPLQA